MIAAVTLGVVFGATSFVPFVVGLRQAKLATRTSNFGHMAILMLALLVSAVILFGAAIACIVVARDFARPFALAEVLTLVVMAVVFGVLRQQVLRR